ncbi:hypothetical protein GCM10023149_37190 [Mucilaginibacter gynuensis]|uniref:Glycosyltransferase 2-like domain-containing protein n=1 Tax=Mucilaginibacter gynuensis TaxID=1302236 RepID=A0ABP8GXK6_9SPHI
MIPNPLVSIITGYYNRESFVDESIQSLLDQTYENIEIIIFDDHSTDNTLNKLQLFADRDSRVKLISHKSNLGFVDGLIHAVSLASGKYIAIHGSGDYSYPQRIEKQVQAFQSATPNLSVVGCFWENYKGGKRIGLYNEKISAGDDCFNSLLKRNIFSHGEVMFNIDFYKEVGGYRKFFKFAQDRDLWCRLSLKSNFFIVPEILYRRINDDENSVRNNHLKKVKQRFYSSFSVQCAEMRKKYGYDYIDILGTEAFALRRPDKQTCKDIYTVALKKYRDGNYKEFEYYYVILKTQKSHFRAFILFLIKKKFLPLNSILRLRNIFK